MIIKMTMNTLINDKTTKHINRVKYI